MIHINCLMCVKFASNDPSQVPRVLGNNNMYCLSLILYVYFGDLKCASSVLWVQSLWALRDRNNLQGTWQWRIHCMQLWAILIPSLKFLPQKCISYPGPRGFLSSSELDRIFENQLEPSNAFLTMICTTSWDNFARFGKKFECASKLLHNSLHKTHSTTHTCLDPDEIQ